MPLHTQSLNGPPSGDGGAGVLRRHFWATMSLVTVACALGAYVSLAASLPTPRLAPVWAPAGIALVALLLFGPRITPALVVGSLAATILSGIPAWASVAAALSVAAEGLAAVYLLRNASDFRADLARVNDILVFLLFAVGIAPMIGATIGTLMLCGGGVVPWADVAHLWRFWWLGDALGTLVVGAFMLALVARFERKVTFLRLVEACGLFALLIGAVTVVHAGVFEADLASPLSFVAFPFVIWAALRFGPKGATAATAVAVAFALWGVQHGEGPFAGARFAIGILFFFGYSTSLATTGLLLSASTVERRRASEELWRIGQDLDIRVRERTADLQEELVRRRRAQEELQSALRNVKTLSGLLPICASCKKIRDDRGYWTQVERYLTDHTQAQFSHGMCPECFAALYPEFADRSGEKPGDAT